MKTVRINDKLSIAGQLMPEDLAEAASQGFTAIINNRPDGEEPHQPNASEMSEAAAKAKLDYIYIPFRSPEITEPIVRQFQQTLADSKGPVLAHCRSGTRTLTLWAIGEVLDGRMTLDEVARMGARLGFDLAGVRAWIAAHR